MMSELLNQVRSEYSKGGLKHVVVGGIEKAIIGMIRKFPLFHHRIASKYFRWRCSDEVEQYQCPPDPFKIEYVSPDNIQKRTGRPSPEYLNRRLLFGKVLDGTWDHGERPIKDSDFYQAAEEHFKKGTPWDEFKFISESLENNENDISDIYLKFDKLYSQIQQNGYKSQQELLENPKDLNNGLFLYTLDEVTVDIGRNGELLHVDGIHRLTIAKIQDLEKIPVVFLVRHKEWMEYREKLCNSDDSIPNHPDLRDLK